MSELLQHLVNGLSLGSVYALIALGYTMVYGVLQLINFAHAEVFMLGAFGGFYSARWLPAFREEPRFLAILVLSMAFCAGVGLAIERLAYRPLRDKPRLNALITAIGVSMLIQAVGQLPWFMGPSPQFFPTLLPNGPLVELGGVSITRLQAVSFVSALALMAALHRLIFHSRLGTAMRAVSFDSRVASLMGINPDRVIAFTFVLGSALAAAAGILVGMSYPRIEPMMGVMLGLKAFVAAVLGGIGNLKGAMAGGILIGLIEALVVGYGTSSYRDAVAFGILIFVLLVKPSGLFGRVATEKV
ncbi:branched-chain amino acid ABC transporter permease [Vulgatibacter incomptus]|uniref:High-affinity branched-chain amino acid transport system permease protein LivH n=1 Tax=Vulgatibacter incomptus TaxID=1391653 RepID=A0A0K1PIZ6_9BACT|nr:branched-chain amino acid ABC transporter permease [Vulgatibacter incomptus]AKU93079.1 High-affinity branched-chain amino acid transport system permease protein LivH [Vulgatibacter incomptus]